MISPRLVSDVKTVRDGVITLRYNPALDGLRAVGGTILVAHHCAPDVFPGASIGVDVFFAPSGYR